MRHCSCTWKESEMEWDGGRNQAEWENFQNHEKDSESIWAILSNTYLQISSVNMSLSKHQKTKNTYYYIHALLHSEHVLLPQGSSANSLEDPAQDHATGHQGRCPLFWHHHCLIYSEDFWNYETLVLKWFGLRGASGQNLTISYSASSRKRRVAQGRTNKSHFKSPISTCTANISKGSIKSPLDRM